MRLPRDLSGRDLAGSPTRVAGGDRSGTGYTDSHVQTFE